VSVIKKNGAGRNQLGREDSREGQVQAHRQKGGDDGRGAQRGAKVLPPSDPWLRRGCRRGRLLPEPLGHGHVGGEGREGGLSLDHWRLHFVASFFRGNLRQKCRLPHLVRHDKQWPMRWNEMKWNN